MIVAGVAFIIQAFLPDTAFHARYALLCIASAGSFASIPPLLGWISSNIHTTGAAGLAIAMNVSFGGPGQIIGVWIYKGVYTKSLVWVRCILNSCVEQLMKHLAISPGI
jgi:hypothetical protein